MQVNSKNGNCTNHTTTNAANANNQSPNDFRMDALKTYLIKDEPETLQRATEKMKEARGNLDGSCRMSLLFKSRNKGLDKTQFDRST